MNQSNETQTLIDFQLNPAFYAEKLRKSHQPLILTIDGRVELVVLDAETYREMSAKAEYAESVQAVKEGIESFERGEGKPAREALEELAEKYGIPR